MQARRVAAHGGAPARRSPGGWPSRRRLPRATDSMQQSPQITDSAVAADDKAPVLLTKFQAHEAAISALAILRDDPSSTRPGLAAKRVVTASLDKTLAVWDLEAAATANAAPSLQVSRLEVAGGPVFSLARGIRTKVTADAPAVKPREPVLFCGLAGKEIVALQPDNLVFSEQMHMNGHTGWVRSLASSGKWLFSCGCNHLHEWDQAYAVPKQVRETSLFTGDILALAATAKAVFTAGADGSLRCFQLGKLGELSEAAVRERAHEGRITALAAHGSLLFSAGYDGSIKAWDVDTLKLVMEVKAAHGGERVRALVMGPTRSSSSSSSTPAATPAATPAGSPGSSSSSSTPAPSPMPPAATAAQDQPTAQGVAQPSRDAVASTLAAAASDDVPPDVSAADDPAAAAAAVGTLTVEPADSVAVTDQAAAAEAAVAVDDGLACLDLPPETPLAHGQVLACSDPPPAAAQSATPPAAAPGVAGGRALSPAPPAVLFSGGDDGLVRVWDVRLLQPAGAPLQVSEAAVKALAVGDSELLAAGNADGQVALWRV